MIWMVEMITAMEDESIDCFQPDVIECRAKNGEPNQRITCDVEVGLDCVGIEQYTNGGRCYDYEVRIGCTDKSRPSYTNDAGSQSDESPTGAK